MPESDAFFANLQRGSMLLQQDRPKDALPYLQTAIAANPDEPRGYAELARCFIELPAHRAKALGAINRAIALAPNESYYYGRKGWYLVCLMDFRGAYKTAQQGLAIDPACPQSLNALANAHTKLAQWKKAEEACRRILGFDPHNEPGLNLLAQALRYLGRWKESREVVARLLADMPNNAFGHANAGYAALAAGDHLRANEHFLESLRMDPHSDLARRGLLQSLRARIWMLRFNHRLACSIKNTSSLNTQAIMLLSMVGGVTLLCLIVHDLGAYAPVVATTVAVLLLAGILLYLALSVVVAFLANFFLLFDPLGRHALTRQEKVKACLPVIPLVFFSYAFVSAGESILVLVMLIVLALIAFSIQFPLIKDRWLRRRAGQSET